jgi:hypothetical protein
MPVCRLSKCLAPNLRCKVTPDLYRELRDPELQALGGPDHGKLRQAVEILDALVAPAVLGSRGTIEKLSPLESR